MQELKSEHSELMNKSKLSGSTQNSSQTPEEYLEKMCEDKDMGALS